MSARKLASNIDRAWNKRIGRGMVKPVALCLSPSAAEHLGDEHTYAHPREIIDTWAWGWSIRMADGSFQP